jgi:hypothetical protein
MTQKNIWYLVILAILLLPGVASAAALKPDPGVLPNSFWFWADEFSEELRFFFTPGDQNKVNYLKTTMAERQAEKDALNVQSITKYNDEIDQKLIRMKAMQDRFSGLDEAATSGQTQWERIKGYLK